ncbi:MAG: outer membrane protein assembly factor BamB family protein [Gemmatimonadota bacterium]
MPATLEVAWDIDAGSGLRSSILVTDSALFVGTTNRQLLAYGTRTGRRYWDQRLEGEIASDLVRSGRTLFMTTTEWNGRIHARDLERGRRVWRKDIGPARHSPLLEGGIVYVATDAGRVYALRSEDGEQLWRGSVRGAAAATPVSHGDALIIVTTLDTLYRVSKKDGAMLGRGHIESSVSAPVATSGGLLVLATHAGIVLGVDAASLQARWRVDTGAPILAAPVIARDGAIHVLNRAGELWRVTEAEAEAEAEAGADAGRVEAVKVADLDMAVTSSFTLARDRYVIGTVNGTVLVTDLAGTVVAQHRFNDSIAGPIAVRAGALYVPLLRGRIVKLR